MGIYYKLVNESARERVEPGRIGGGGIKGPAVVLGPTSRLFAMLRIYATGWELVSDGTTGDLYDAAEDFADVTEREVERFNKLFPEATIELYVESGHSGSEEP